MSSTPPGPDFAQDLRLRDGTPVRLRAARGDDRQRLVEFFDHLEPRTIYTRFFGYRKTLTDTELGQLDANDFVARTILLATAGSGPDETVIGAGSYVADAASGNPPQRAEVAFTVEEDYQGRGLASLLLRTLIGIARAHGLRELTAEVLAENAPMLAVFRRCGLPTTTRRSGGVVEWRFALAPAGA
jgi:GNAT superfamily N-acetyltransferase